MPMELNKELRPETQLHKRIIDAVKRRRDLSVRTTEKKHSAWNEAEKLHSGYLYESERAARVKQGRKFAVTDYTTINVSSSYATTMAMHTYWTSVFLARNPAFQLTARHGESEMQIQAMEALMDYQLMVGRQLVPYYVWLLDVGKFGVGFIGNYWDEKYAISSHFEDIPQTYLGIPIPGKTRRARITDRLLQYSGSSLFNIRPYDMRIDPRIDLQNYQQGEFMGRKGTLSWMQFVQGVADGKYFNQEALEKRRLSKWNHTENQVGNQMYPESDLSASTADMDMMHTDNMEFEEMVITIQPDKWHLGKTSYPEKWIFTVIEDEVCIRCRPLGCHHGMFPYSVLEYEMDGGLLFKRGVHEVLGPMEETLNWLVNTHFFNTRRILNDNIIVDPSRVVMKDFMNNKPGKMVRLKPSAYGEDPNSVYSQMKVVDVTNQHLADMRIIDDLAHKLVGVNDNIMGTVHPGGRKTATEIRTSSGFGINRLKTNSEWFSASGWQDNASMMIANTQQYYDDEREFKIAGELSAELRKRIITPEDIAGQYDFVPVDGTLPIDRFAQANLWKELFQALAGMQEAGIDTGFDLSKIFSYTAQLAGAKNINQFKVQVLPDEELQDGIQRGNIRPIPGGGAGGGPGGNPEAAGPLQNTSPIAQLGPVG